MKVFMTLPAGAPADGIKVVVEGNLLRLYFNYAKETETKTSSDGSGIKNGNMDNASYSAENIDIQGGVRDYAAITAAIVNDMYDVNDVQAILANKALADDAKSDITDEKRKEYLEEYTNYQAYRVKAKETAAKAVEILAASAEKASTGTEAAATDTTATDNAAKTTADNSEASTESSNDQTSK